MLTALTVPAILLWSSRMRAREHLRFPPHHRPHHIYALPAHLNTSTIQITLAHATQQRMLKLNISTLVIVTVPLLVLIIIVYEMYRADRTWYHHNVYMRLVVRSCSWDSVRDMEEGAETSAKTMTEKGTVETRFYQDKLGATIWTSTLKMVFTIAWQIGYMWRLQTMQGKYDTWTNIMTNWVWTGKLR